MAEAPGLDVSRANVAREKTKAEKVMYGRPIRRGPSLVGTRPSRLRPC
jgi:hypothetical protein